MTGLNAKLFTVRPKDGASAFSIHVTQTLGFYGTETAPSALSGANLISDFKEHLIYLPISTTERSNNYFKKGTPIHPGD